MFLADLHIHSKYSRATSKDCVAEALDLWARRKGLDLIGTGDFTHPAWREELGQKLVPAEDGLYTLRDECRRPQEGAAAARRPRFVVTGEISSIYKKNGQVRKVHNVIVLPGLEAAERLAKRLEEVGNLHSDGRPILGLDSRDLLEIVLECCPRAVFIPAHIWTPHFSLFGAYSGFDTIEECFEDMTPYIHTLETGLSSDPPMNWRLSALDRYGLISCSDAHSPQKLAREATVFDTEMSYPALKRALDGGGGLHGTIEFFPEEGKYHYDGHRPCKLCCSPQRTQQENGVCPLCGKRITVGVLHRVEDLADREEGFVPPGAAPFESLVPLPEVIAASTGWGAGSVRVTRQYEALVRELGPELPILRQIPLEDIERHAGVCVAEGIRRLRQGRVELLPGYDGEFGKVKLLDPDEIGLLAGQMTLFQGILPEPPKAKKPAARPSAPARRKGTPRPKKAAAAKRKYGLNPEQWEAASAPEPVVAVVAGPGTGKTRTLVCRILHLVEECGVPPEQIVAVTFTNQAAGEMRARLTERLSSPEAARALRIGTFHSLCLRLLQKEPVVIDEEDAQSLLADVMRRLGVRGAARERLREISLVKNGAREAGELSALLDAYDEELRQCGACDFDDLLLEALRQERSGPLCAHLLVDEFQDCNDLQYRLLRAWAPERLFVIGDPDQAIYGFRGSDARCFTRLLEDHPGARAVRLTKNYRSTPEILRCALPVLPMPEGESPFLLAQRESGEAVALLRARDAYAQGVFLAKEIGRLVGGVGMLEAHEESHRQASQGHPRGFGDIAVLYRTHRQAQVIEQCLIQEGIPYLVRGRDDFLAEEPVRRAVAFFRFLLRPEDRLALRLCLRGAGAKGAALDALLDRAQAGEPRVETVCAAIGEDAPAGLAKLAAMMRKYAPLARDEKPAALVEAYAMETGQEEEPSLERLHSAALFHEDMASFLNALTLGTEGDVARAGGRTYHPDAVTLLTLHGSKGLEFPVVFLCGVSRGTIPFERGGTVGDIGEERRLFYVGMTRAEDRLTLLCDGEPSEFLSDIPPECYETVDAAQGRRPAPMRQLSLFD